MSLAGIVVYSYSFLIPALIYGFVRWRSGPFDFYLSDFVSIYGYSLLVFVPMSMLLLISNNTFNWLLIVVSLAISGSVLASKIWGATQHVEKQLKLILVLVVLALHASLVFFIKLYFFSHVKTPSVLPTTAVTSTSPTLNVSLADGS